MQAGVLADLLEHLQMTPAVLFGTSNGGRLSLCFASAYPELCAGIVLNNLTAGPLAAQCLSRKYYLRFADVVDMYAKDAMAFLCKEPFFEELCEANPDNRARLLATPPAVFKERMRQWGNALQDGGNTGAYPVLGIEARRLRGVRAPALCLYTFRREADGMHTPECMQAVSALLPGADGKVVTSADRDVWIKSVIDFVEALPKPLKARPCACTRLGLATPLRRYATARPPRRGGIPPRYGASCCPMRALCGEEGHCSRLNEICTCACRGQRLQRQGAGRFEPAQPTAARTQQSQAPTAAACPRRQQSPLLCRCVNKAFAGPCAISRADHYAS